MRNWTVCEIPFKVHITPLTKFRPETPLWGQNVTCKIFPESELWFSHNLDFCFGNDYQFRLIMMSTKGLILRRYMAENSKNVNISQNKTSILMIFRRKLQTNIEKLC